MKKIRITICLAAVAAISACGGGGGDDNPPPVVKTASVLANEQIVNTTTDTATPITLNDLTISDQDTDDTSSPVPVT